MNAVPSRWRRWTVKLAQHAAWVLPGARSPWADAMRRELDYISGRSGRLALGARLRPRKLPGQIDPSAVFARTGRLAAGRDQRRPDALDRASAPGKRRRPNGIAPACLRRDHVRSVGCSAGAPPQAAVRHRQRPSQLRRPRRGPFHPRRSKGNRPLGTKPLPGPRAQASGDDPRARGWRDRAGAGPSARPPIWLAAIRRSAAASI